MEESRKLMDAGIDTDTADMCYIIDDETKTYRKTPVALPYNTYTAKEFYVPCWSLGALYGLMPCEIALASEVVRRTVTGNRVYYATHPSMKEPSALSEISDNDTVVDACVKMVLRLAECSLIETNTDKPNRIPFDLVGKTVHVNGLPYILALQLDTSAPCSKCAFLNRTVLMCGFPKNSMVERQCLQTSGVKKGWRTLEYIKKY